MQTKNVGSIVAEVMTATVSSEPEAAGIKTKAHTATTKMRCRARHMPRRCEVRLSRCAKCRTEATICKMSTKPKKARRGIDMLSKELSSRDIGTTPPCKGALAKLLATKPRYVKGSKER